MIRITILLVLLGALSAAMTGCHAEADVDHPHSTTFMHQ